MTKDKVWRLEDKEILSLLEKAGVNIKGVYELMYLVIDEEEIYDEDTLHDLIENGADYKLITLAKWFIRIRDKVDRSIVDRSIFGGTCGHCFKEIDCLECCLSGEGDNLDLEFGCQYLFKLPTRESLIKIIELTWPVETNSQEPLK
jgi:hypothetical protein